MGKRHRARAVALQVLYGIDLTGEDPKLAFERAIESFALPPEMSDFAFSLVRGVTETRERLDTLIGQVSEHWRLDRMSVVDRNILRLAAYELAHALDVPARVVLDEAIEIAKEFGTEASPAFINGVLDRLAATVRERCGEEQP
jgi:N utilization substance protein B